MVVVEGVGEEKKYVFIETYREETAVRPAVSQRVSCGADTHLEQYG